MIPAWSYSSIKTFDQCPKKYFHLRIKKDFKDEDSTATILARSFTQLRKSSLNRVRRSRRGLALSRQHLRLSIILEARSIVNSNWESLNAMVSSHLATSLPRMSGGGV
jgi:hypothetical protein